MAKTATKTAAKKTTAKKTAARKTTAAKTETEPMVQVDPETGYPIDDKGRRVTSTQPY